MTASILFVLLAVSGWFLLDFFKPKITVIEHLGLSILVSSGLFSIIFYLLSIYLQLLPPSSMLLQLTAYTSIITFFRFATTSKTTHFITKFKPLNLPQILLIVATLCSVSYTLLQVFYWPPHNPDAIHLYDFRALRIAEGDFSGFYSGQKFLNTVFYPPYTSIMHSFMYLTSLSNSGIFYGVLYVSFLTTILGFVYRKSLLWTLSLLTVCAITFTPSILWNSFLTITNIVYMEYIALSLLYLSEINQSAQGKTKIILAGILLALSTWVRSEIIWLPLLLPLLIVSYKSKYFLTTIIILTLIITTSLIWNHTQPKNDLPFQSQSSQVLIEISSATRIVTHDNSTDSILKIIPFVIKALVTSWSFVLPLYIAMLTLELLLYKKISSFHLLIFWVAISLVLGFVLTAIRFGEWVGLEDAIYRMGVIVIPLFWVAIFTSINPNKLKLVIPANMLK